MKNKVTLVKVGKNNYKPTVEDLEKWRDVFEKAKNDPEYMAQIQMSKEVSVEEIDFDNDDQHVAVIKINCDGFQPTKKDLEAWKQIFQEAQSDPDFVILTHSKVNIEKVKIGKNTKIIVGDAVVLNDKE